VINVAVTIDRNYVQPLGVMLNSLLLNTASPVHITLLHIELTPEDIALLNELVAQHAHARIDCHRIPSEKIKGFAASGHLKSIAYGYFLLPDILPQTEQKVICLDPDTIVLSDIKELWNTELGDSLLAAVPIISPPGEKIVEAGEPFFNSGVIVVNLQQWRIHHVVDQALAVAKELRDYIRGDVVNVVARGRWKKLPLCWNKRPNFFVNQDNSIYSAEEVEAAREEVGILHFTGPIKPWHYACSHPKRACYLEYKKDTPWEAVPLEGKNLLALFFRLLPMRVYMQMSWKFAHSPLAEFVKKRTLE